MIIIKIFEIGKRKKNRKKNEMEKFMIFEY